MVAFHNTYGNSAWSTPLRCPGLRTVYPGGAALPHLPDAGLRPLRLVEEHRQRKGCHELPGGAAMLRNGAYGPWVYTVVAPTVYYTNFRGLPGIAACQVKVRASNRVGNSSWSAVSSIRKALKARAIGCVP